MDEEITDGYSEPCGQCGSVCWGVTNGGQFFCKNCHNVIEFTPQDQTSDTEVESSAAFSDASCHSETGSMMGASSVSGYSSDGRSSVCSGSMDAECYFGQKDRKNLMTMPRTLAFCYLALLWVREAITLADLLRLVSKGHIPYVNAHALFPEDMKFFGKDAMIFRVESIPSYSNVHRDAASLAALIELPAFPPVTPDCLLHPALLTLRYLMDANLPDKLHALVREVIQKTSMGTDSFLTFDPTERKPRLPCYDLQAAALIVVCMKLLFRLDDNVEWKLAKKSDEKINEMDHGKSKTTKRGGKMFSLRKWFMVVQPALERARKKEQQATAMQQWKSETPIIPSLKHKTVVLKRRRVVEQLQSSFKALSGSAPEQQASTPSSFTFLWGDEDGADGPSLHHRCLDYLMMNKKRIWHFVNRKYWHTDLRRCHKRQCGDHFGELEPTLPRMYVWLLGLFSFMLGVEDAKLHGAVVQVEQGLLRKTGHKETPENLDE
ncbi:TATA box-binding protein-associated factor RNA polymerase I subunit B isoform X3 [Ictalurus punctatus]|uniref:TATA box-binding protein-associated factor RNA polymerase I subunit B n=1 Tax=Ictalurus punctatus TaxID=7998 RepID=A0A2D0PYK1_ICTPU|nr:TATA box-binding protein-associated factor RNA polymerase I subunit B isoform X3 [Ictalurus punctatus]